VILKHKIETHQKKRASQNVLQKIVRRINFPNSQRREQILLTE